MLVVLLGLTLLSVQALGTSPGPAKPIEPTSNPNVNFSPPITREDLRRMGVLNTLAVQVEQTIEAHRTGLVGGVRCVLLARGEIILGVDLTTADLQADTDPRTLTVTLSQPFITQSRLDHERSHILALERLSLWRLAMGDALEADVVQDALSTAQRELADYPLQFKHMQAARHEVEQVLHRMIEPTGWRCEVVWTQVDPQGT
jgi:hypothetical protein